MPSVYRFNEKKRCQNHNGGGFNDWRLPEIGDLVLMYENLHIKSMGGFTSGSNVYYWSSSQNNSGWYQVLGFQSGVNNLSSISSLNRVRAVRSFSIH